MRLAYLLKKFPRLSETFILTEILAQESRGTEVHVFSRRRPDDEPRHAALANLRARVEVFPTSSDLDPWNIVFAGGQSGLTAEDWTRLRSVVLDLSPLIGERFPRLIAEALHCRRRCIELDIDHLHVHFATESAVVAMLVQELGGPSYSITAHAKDIYRCTVRKDLLDLMVRKAAFVVTVCDANVEFLRGMLSDAAQQRVRRLYNGIDLERFPLHAGPRDPARILSVGRLVEKKGFGVLIQALAELDRRGVPYAATIIGDGEDRERLEARAHAAGLSGRLEFAGPQEQAKVLAAMQSASVFCLPCVIGEDGNRDALPTVLLEALAVGLPCISTPVTGIPEILDGGRAGRLVAEHDWSATADAMQELLQSPGERQRLAKLGNARAQRMFDSQRSAETLAHWFLETRAKVAAK